MRDATETLTYLRCADFLGSKNTCVAWLNASKWFLLLSHFKRKIETKLKLPAFLDWSVYDDSPVEGFVVPER